MLNRKTAPDFKEVKSLNLIEAQTTLLDNGLKVHTINAGTQPIVKIEFIFKANALNQGIPFLSNATNTLVGEGTRNYTADEIAQKIDFFGAFLHKSSTIDSSTVALYTLNKHLPEILPILKELIFSSTIPQSELDLYIQNSKQEYNINLSKVSTLAIKKFREVLLGNTHPYGYYTNINEYNNLTRTIIEEYYQKWYDLSKTEIIASGFVDAEVLKLLNNHFGQISVNFNKIEEQEFEIKSSSKNKHFVNKDDAIQSAIRIGRPMFTRQNSEHPEFQVLNCILGGYFGSRLMANIREDKGFTYGIGSGLASYKNFGYFYISTEVKAEVREQAVNEIYYEINRLKKDTVAEEELQLVKNYLMGALLRSADGAFNQADMYKTLLTNNLDYTYYSNYVNTIKTIDSNRIKELANKYFKEEDLFEVVAGK